MNKKRTSRTISPEIKADCLKRAYTETNITYAELGRHAGVTSGQIEGWHQKVLSQLEHILFKKFDDGVPIQLKVDVVTDMLTTTWGDINEIADDYRVNADQAEVWWQYILTNLQVFFIKGSQIRPTRIRLKDR